MNRDESKRVIVDARKIVSRVSILNNEMTTTNKLLCFIVLLLGKSNCFDEWRIF